MLNDRKRLVEVHLDSCFHHFWAIISPSARFCSLHHSFDHDILWNIIVQNLVNRLNIIFKIFTLFNCPWITINQVVFRWRGKHPIQQHLHSHLKWHKLSLIHYCLDLLSLFASTVDNCSHEISSWNMCISKFLHHSFTLCAFSCSWPTNDECDFAITELFFNVF